MDSPIGRLIVESETKAKTKARGHTATAACGCEVTVTYFTANSSTNLIEPCTVHRPGVQPKRKAA